MKDLDLQTLWCRGMSVLPSSTMMVVLPLLLLICNNNSHLEAVKTLLCFIIENIHQSCIVHSSELLQQETFVICLIN